MTTSRASRQFFWALRGRRKPSHGVRPSWGDFRETLPPPSKCIIVAGTSSKTAHTSPARISTSFAPGPGSRAPGPGALQGSPQGSLQGALQGARPSDRTRPPPRRGLSDVRLEGSVRSGIRMDARRSTTCARASVLEVVDSRTAGRLMAYCRGGSRQCPSSMHVSALDAFGECMMAKGHRGGDLPGSMDWYGMDSMCPNGGTLC
jgi:hypothetical protein